MIAASAVVPPQNMVNCFDKFCVAIWNQCDVDAGEVLDYFEDTYTKWWSEVKWSARRFSLFGGHFRRNAPRRSPLFSIKLWNMFNRTAEELPRTNSNIDTLHNSFQANVSSTDPTFWKFLDALLREECIVRVRML